MNETKLNGGWIQLADLYSSTSSHSKEEKGHKKRGKNFSSFGPQWSPLMQKADRHSNCGPSEKRSVGLKRKYGAGLLPTVPIRKDPCLGLGVVG